jgi:hypothetical protein
MCPKAAHSKTVAAEAQVPGPGRMRPKPKKVATREAQRGVELRLTVLPTNGRPAGSAVSFTALSSLLFVHIFGRTDAELFLGIRNRRRNYVLAACPLAEINGAAVIAAEREVGVAAFHSFLADRAAEFQSSLARHGSELTDSVKVRTARTDPGQLKNSRYQIIVVRFGDLATIKLSRARLFSIRNIVHKNLTVDFRGVHASAAFHKEIGFL